MIVFLMVLSVFVKYGVHGSQPIQTNLEFDVTAQDNRAVCKPKPKELILPENSSVKMFASMQTKLEEAKCHYMVDGRPHNLGNEYIRSQNNPGGWIPEHKITKDMYGKWSCKLKFNKNQVAKITPVEQEPNGDRYNYVNCDITVRNPDVHFDIRVRSDHQAVCVPSQKELVLPENTVVRLSATWKGDTKSIEMVECYYRNDTRFKLVDNYDKEEANSRPWTDGKPQIKKDMYGTWTCKLTFNKDLDVGEIEPVRNIGGTGYNYVFCNITVRDPDWIGNRGRPLERMREAVPQPVGQSDTLCSQ